MCEKLKLKISPNGQLVKLGDGCTTLAANGEIDTSFSRDKWTVRFRAIVVEKLNSDIYGGMTFLTDNDISLRAKTGEIKLHNKHIVLQTNTLMLPPQIKNMYVKCETVRLPKCQLFPKFSCVSFHSVPNEEKSNYNASSLTVPLPASFEDADFVFVSPRHENHLDDWPPEQICPAENNCITIFDETEKNI